MASIINVDQINEATSGSGVQIPGHAIQVVQATTTTVYSSTSTSFVDSGLSVTITPKSSSSKILVTADFGVAASTSSGAMIFNLLRGSTQLFYRGVCYSTAGGIYSNAAFFHLDSPATTSANTYKIQYVTQSASSTAYVNVGYSGYSNPTAHITAMEIAQ